MLWAEKPVKEEVVVENMTKMKETKQGLAFEIVTEKKIGKQAVTKMKETKQGLAFEIIQEKKPGKKADAISDKEAPMIVLNQRNRGLAFEIVDENKVIFTNIYDNDNF